MSYLEYDKFWHEINMANRPNLGSIYICKINDGYIQDGLEINERIMYCVAIMQSDAFEKDHYYTLLGLFFDIENARIFAKAYCEHLAK